MKPFFIICVSLLFSCLGSEPEEPIGDNNHVLLSEIENIDTSPGTIEVSLLLENGQRINILAHFPEKLKDASFILGLHWAGDQTTFRTYGPCQAIDGLKSTESVIITPSVHGGVWWDETTQSTVIDMLNKMIKTWEIDKTKIAVTGYSNGGTGTWAYAKKFPSIFSAAIPVSGSYPSPTKFDIPVFAIHGEKDELFPLAGAETVITNSINLGSDIQLLIAPGLTHFEGCAFKSYLQEAGLWLTETVWK